MTKLSTISADIAPFLAALAASQDQAREANAQNPRPSRGLWVLTPAQVAASGARNALEAHIGHAICLAAASDEADALSLDEISADDRLPTIFDLSKMAAAACEPHELCEMHRSMIRIADEHAGDEAVMRSAIWHTLNICAGHPVRGGDDV